MVNPGEKFNIIFYEVLTIIGWDLSFRELFTRDEIMTLLEIGSEVLEEMETTTYQLSRWEKGYLSETVDKL